MPPLDFRRAWHPQFPFRPPQMYHGWRLQNPLCRYFKVHILRTIWTVRSFQRLWNWRQVQLVYKKALSTFKPRDKNRTHTHRVPRPSSHASNPISIQLECPGCKLTCISVDTTVPEFTPTIAERVLYARQPLWRWKRQPSNTHWAASDGSSSFWNYDQPG